MTVTTVEGNVLAIEHLCDVLRRSHPAPHGEIGVVSCLRSGNPSRHPHDPARGSRVGATTNEGFWSLTIEPPWAASLTREIVRMTSREELDIRATEIDFGDGTKAPGRAIEATTRRDQPMHAADVLRYFLAHPERRQGIEAVWRMGGPGALEGPIAAAMQTLPPAPRSNPPELSDPALAPRPSGMLIIAPASHLDHDLTPAHVAWLLAHLGDRSAFFVETVTLPDDLPPLPCGLYGPSMGDDPVPETAVLYALRKGRRCSSRLVDRPLRPTRLLTVIAGPSDEGPCVLYTSYGGPAAPREPGDTSLPDWAAVTEARTFWAAHALALGPTP